MSDILRDAAIGQIIRLVTNNRLLQYPEERDDFKYTADYLERSPAEGKPPVATTSSNTIPVAKSEETGGEAAAAQEDADTSDDESTTQSLRAKLTMSRILSRPIIMERTVTMAEVAQAYNAAVDVENISQQVCQRIKPHINEEGVMIVDWYSTTDPENPQHYSKGKKWAVVLQL